MQLRVSAGCVIGKMRSNPCSICVLLSANEHKTNRKPKNIILTKLIAIKCCIDDIE